MLTGRIVPPTYPPANQEEPIAFYAYMSAPMSNIGGHHTLIYDVIKLTQVTDYTLLRGYSRRQNLGFMSSLGPYEFSTIVTMALNL